MANDVESINQLPKDHFLVTQSNDLIEARHKKPLNKNEQKIILMMISMIQPQDEDFKEYLFTVRDFSRILGLSENNHSIHKEMKKTMENLMSKVIEIQSEESPTGWKLLHWVSTAEYIEGDGLLKIEFHYKLKPYLLQLKKSYSQYQLKNVLSLTSGYSIRLYELFKKWEKVGHLEIDLDDLRSRIGAIKKTFQRYYEFKVKILDKYIEEINQKTDLQVSYVESKKIKKKVLALKFTIKRAAKAIDDSIIEDTDIVRRNQLVSKMRGPINKNLNTYEFSAPEFAIVIEAALLVWPVKTEQDIYEELRCLSVYADTEPSITKPVGYVISELRKAKELVETGIEVSYIKNNKFSKKSKESIPEWFYKKEDEQPVTIFTPEQQKLFQGIMSKRLSGEPLTEEEEELQMLWEESKAQKI